MTIPLPNRSTGPLHRNTFFLLLETKSSALLTPQVTVTVSPSAGGKSPSLSPNTGLFEKDEDRVEDCFLFVCEALLANDFHRLRSFQPAGPTT